LDVLKNINPLSILPVRIHRDASGTFSASSRTNKNATLSRIGDFLVSQLRVEYELKKDKIRGLEAGVALTKLNDQIVAYAKRLWPFNQTSISQNNVVKYWADLMEHNDADVLAVRHLQI